MMPMCNQEGAIVKRFALLARFAILIILVNYIEALALQSLGEHERGGSDDKQS